MMCAAYCTDEEKLQQIYTAIAFTGTLSERSFIDKRVYIYNPTFILAFILLVFGSHDGGIHIDPFQ